MHDGRFGVCAGYSENRQPIRLKASTPKRACTRGRDPWGKCPLIDLKTSYGRLSPTPLGVAMQVLPNGTKAASASRPKIKITNQLGYLLGHLFAVTVPNY